MSDAVLLIDDGNKCCRRICHEQDLESCKSLETPCHCSRTLKFAHRDCIQRWCEENGNTTCKICLQVLVVKAICVIVPMCMLFRIATVIRISINHQQYYHQNLDSYVVSSTNENGQDDEDIDGDDNV